MPSKYINKRRETSRKFYYAHKEKMMARAKLWDLTEKKKCQEYILSFLKEHPCVDCGETNPIVLDFDHRDRKDKKHNISNLAGGRFAIATMIEEIKKCDIRCANCHRKKTYKESGWSHRN